MPPPPKDFPFRESQQGELKEPPLSESPYWGNQLRGRNSPHLHLSPFVIMPKEVILIYHVGRQIALSSRGDLPVPVAPRYFFSI